MLSARAGQESPDPGSPQGLTKLRLRSARLHPRIRGIAAAISVSLAVVLGAWGLGCDGSQPEPVPTITSDILAPTPTDQSAGGVPGLTDDEILFGQSAAFTGPAQKLGKNMQLGILAAFHEVNQAGGVHGRTLRLTFKDDGYEPEAAANNTIQLIKQERVFALIGAVGTPTSRSATPVADEAGVPYIGPFTGAEFLRSPELPTVLNLRASYFQETEEMVARLTEDLGIQRIAVMYQDDSFGRAGYNGVLLALERRGMEPAAIGLYPRNTTAVKTGLLELRLGNPQAVILIGAYEPVAALISWARHAGMDPIFMTVSFVGSNALANELGKGGTGVYVTQVVPFPTDDSIPAVAAYLKALTAFDAAAIPGFVSFEGYLAGRLAIAGLEACGQELDRDCFLNSLWNAGNINIDGFQLRYGHRDNQGSDDVFLTVIDSTGNYRPVESLRDSVP